MTKPADKTVSRRKAMVAIGGGAVVAGGIAQMIVAAPSSGGSSGGTSLWGKTPTDLANAGMATWQSLIGATFTIVHERGSSDVRLTAVDALPSSGVRPPGTRDKAFAVRFAKPSTNAPAGDRIYTVKQKTAYDQVTLFSPTASFLMAVFN